MRPVQNEITTEVANEGIFDLEQCTRNGLVFSISGAGTTLSGGTLELAPEAYIVFNSSCTDVMLEDIVIQGMSASIPHRYTDTACYMYAGDDRRHGPC